MTSDTIEYLAEIVEALRDLCGAIIDNMPPDSQNQIADVQANLITIAQGLKFRREVPDPVGAR